MKKLVWALVVFAFTLSVHADEFARSSKFESVEAFVTAAKSFEPAKTKGEMAALFTVKELGQSEDPKTGTPVPAKAIESCETLYVDDQLALVWVKAHPPTDATRSVVAVLFLLKSEGASWQIVDLLRFEASGKYSEVKAELTAVSYNGKRDPGFLTITEFQGGRGYSSSISASYACRDYRFKRVDLE
ncbi:MAG: hypothetical protein WCH57_07345 [Verrucomicrobiota bacterium]